MNPEKTTYHQKSIPHIVALDSWQRASSRCDGPIGSAIYYGRLFGYLKGERLSGGMINQTTSSGVKMDKFSSGLGTVVILVGGGALLFKILDTDFGFWLGMALLGAYGVYLFSHLFKK